MSRTTFDEAELQMWLDLCRRVVDRQRPLFAESVTRSERSVYEGRGEGGDRTLVLDRQCEDVIFEELEEVAATGNSFTAISEERGTVEFGDGGSRWVVIDPIDGSLNVRRTLPGHSVSIAVADGPDMASVRFGYVYDFGAREEFRATAGGGAWLDDRPMALEGIDLEEGEMLELVGVEGAEPTAFLPFVEGLAGQAYRLRCVGSLAITVSWLGAGRIDGMVSPHPSRSVDVAAAQLIAREAGALVGLGEGDLSTVGFELDSRFRVMGATTPSGLEIIRASRPAPDHR